jgi:Mg-chelatase subunit ChlD
VSIETLINDWRLAVDDYAKAKAEAEYLKEFRKSKKAILVIEAEKKEKIKTGAMREAYAYSHADYMQLLEGLKVATEKAESLRWRMTIAQERVNVWRTKQANGRKEQGMYSA